MEYVKDDTKKRERQRKEEADRQSDVRMERK